VTDIAATLIGDRPIKMIVTGIRPGEKIHEILVSEEEAHRTISRGKYYVIQPILPELRGEVDFGHTLDAEYSSADNLMIREELRGELHRHGLLIEDLETDNKGELIR